MNPNDKIDIVQGDDWMGVYVNRNLIDEGHSFNGREVLKILNIPVKYIDADIEWLESRGNLPKDLNEVVKAKR